MKHPPRRILVIKLRHLGDVLLMTPVYRSLARHFPRAEITACVNAGTEGVLKNNPDVHEILAVARETGQLSFLRELRRKRFDLVLDFTGSDRSALLTRITGAAERWGYHRKKGFFGRNLCYTRTVHRKRDVHVIEAQAAFLREMGIETPSTRLRFEVVPQAEKAISALLPPGNEWVHIHPVSRLMEKCWPAPYLAELVDYVADRGLTPVITASRNENEQAFVQDLISRLRRPALDLTAKLDLQELGALSKRARLFIGVDSAPMHIAAAVGTPVIGIFGPSSEVLWGPWCEQRLVLSRDLPCRLPCKAKNTCPHIECLRAFTPGMVLPQVSNFLNAVLNEKALA